VPELRLLLDLVQFEQHMIGDEDAVFIPIAQLDERVWIFQ
jgi:hypothetical protein